MKIIFLVLLWAMASVSSFAQESLQQEIRDIAVDAKGQVAVACSLPGSTLNCDLNPNGHPPMQSVFKLPLALTILYQVEQGKLGLDQAIRFLPRDRMVTNASPLQDKYPDGNADVPLRELLRLSVSISDNVASDILLRVAGGPEAVDRYMAALGVHGFRLRDSEGALHREPHAQYRNWIEPAGAVQLLRLLADKPPISIEHQKLLFGWMTPARHTARLDANLPDDVLVAHKSGTSDVDAGLAHATNDIGLIPLPDGRALAIAVFVTDSRADQTIREQIIARIAKAAYDASIKK